MLQRKGDLPLKVEVIEEEEEGKRISQSKAVWMYVNAMVKSIIFYANEK